MLERSRMMAETLKYRPSYERRPHRPANLLDRGPYAAAPRRAYGDHGAGGAHQPVLLPVPRPVHGADRGRARAIPAVAAVAARPPASRTHVPQRQGSDGV